MRSGGTPISSRLARLLLLPLALHARVLPCQPSACFEGGCSEAPVVSTHAQAVTVDRWNAQNLSYVPESQLQAQVLIHTNFTIFMHGPRLLSGGDNSTVPTAYFVDSNGDAVYRLDAAVNPDAHTTMTGHLQQIATVMAPSTLFPITTQGRTVESFMVAQGSLPIFQEPRYFPKLVERGGVNLVRSAGCQQIFPLKAFRTTGRVVNTVDCDAEVGVCFFTIWKFYNTPRTWPFPDCVVWCIPDNITNPMSCVAEGTLEYPNGTQVCRNAPIGGVHSIKVLRNDRASNSSIKLLLLFTGGAGFDQGQSAAVLLTTAISHGNGTAPGLHTTAMAWWGSSLWQDTVLPPHNVGLDHAWQDGAGAVWITTFRKGNAGLHMLTPEGILQLSLHGFTQLNTTDDFRYPSGLHGVGQPGVAGSWIAVTTSSTQWHGGHGALFLVDVSDLHVQSNV